MARESKRVFKLFFAWQEEQEAQWLNEMSQQGWHVESYFPAFYTLVKGEPKNYIYKFDYKTSSNRDLADYITIFEDAGWEHVLQYLGWHYFRTEASEGQTPDIFSDNASRLQKYKGLNWLFTVILVVNLPLLVNSLRLAHVDSFAAGFTMGVHIGAVALMGYAKFKIYEKMKKLKNRL